MLLDKALEAIELHIASVGDGGGSALLEDLEDRKVVLLDLKPLTEVVIELITIVCSQFRIAVVVWLCVCV